MKNFLLVKKQEQPGCDYSIDCGVAIEFFQAEFMEAAQKKLLNLEENWRQAARVNPDPLYYLDLCIRNSVIWGFDTRNVDLPIKEVTLYEVSQSFDAVLLLKEKLAEINQFSSQLKKELESKAILAKERAEYERLKKKFEK